MVSIHPCSVAMIMKAATFPTLIEEYAQESAIDGMPSPAVKIESYQVYEGLGMLRAFAAVENDNLIGFIAVLMPTLPHYGVTVAVVESFFVSSVYRKSGAGLELLREAEKVAKESGSPGLLVSAPSGGRLAEVLPRRGYKETNRIYFKPVEYDA